MAWKEGLTYENESTTSHVVLEAIAEQEGIDVIDMTPPEYPPLYTVIDPDALDSLFDRPSTDGERFGRVVFEYGSYEVTVHSDGTVDVSTDSTGQMKR